MRTGQRQHRPFGSGRFFWVQTHHGARSGWYYETRDGARGPFSSRQMAEESFSGHVQQRAGR